MCFVITRANAVRFLLPTVYAFVAALPLQVDNASAQFHVVSEQHAAMHEFHIAAGQAQQTLNEFGRQSGLQLLFDFNSVSGITTREVNGEMEPTAALKSMIAGTPLAFEFVNAGTVTIMRNPKASSSGDHGTTPNR